MSHGASGGGYGSVSAATVAVTVDDDEVAVEFGAADYTVTEGSTVTVTVTLSDDPGRQVVVPVEARNLGGASAGDYTLSATMLTFDSADTSKTFVFTATDDTDDDGGESVELSFGTLPGGVVEGSTNESTVTIVDGPGIVLSKTSLSITEGGAGETYTVRLATQPSAQVQVLIRGAVGSDLNVVASRLTFTTANWDTAQTVTVSSEHDADSDPDTVVLTHQAASTDSDYAP